MPTSLDADPIYSDLGPPGASTDLDANEQRVLASINDRVAACQSTEDIVDFLVEQTADVCPCDRVSVAFVEEQGRRLVSHYSRAHYAPLLLKRGYAEDLQGSSLERVIADGQLRIIDNLEEYLARHPTSRSTRLLVREGVRSNLTCPLQVDGRAVGVLFRSSRRPGAYEMRHARLHALVAARLGQAVEKTYRLEQLAAANLAYSEMLGFVSHELKSPVAAMISTAQLLREGYVGEISTAQRETLDRLINKGHYLLDLVRDYLDLARLEGGTLKFEPRPEVDLERDVVRLALDVVRPEATAKAMRLHVDVANASPLRGDPDLLRIVLVNLVGNAVKYGREGGLVQIVATRNGPQVEVSVRNEGVGFPPEQQSRLFRKFSRLETPELRSIKGSGVGLYTVWRIVQLHGGRVGAQSKPGEWADFWFHLPQSVSDPSAA